MASLEGELVTRKRKTRQDKTSQGKDEARQGRSLQVKSVCWGFHSKEFDGIIQILNLRIGTTVPFKTKNNF